MTRLPHHRSSQEPESYDPAFEQEMQRLHQLTVYGRWLVAVVLWLTVGVWSLWSLRPEFELWREYFTWAAVRYAIVYNRLPSLGLSLCIGTTLAILVWQSRNIVWGFSKEERQRLSRQVSKIRQQGPSHPLWKWVCDR